MEYGDQDANIIELINTGDCWSGLMDLANFVKRDLFTESERVRQLGPPYDPRKNKFFALNYKAGSRLMFRLNDDGLWEARVLGDRRD